MYISVDKSVSFSRGTACVQQGSPIRTWFFGISYSLIMLPALFLAPALISRNAGGATSIASNPALSDPAVRAVLERPFLSTDIRHFSHLNAAMLKIQLEETRLRQQLDPVELSELSSDGLLIRWAQIERTARRHKCTLDYFIGFGF